MRLFNQIFLVSASVLMLFSSCKNDLNILAPYKETVSVYALLNPQEKTQFVRINKIFLGEGNAYTMAQVADSVNYKAGELTVKLERYYFGVKSLTTVGNTTKTQIILKDTLIQTQSGIFNSTQRLFYTNDKLYTNGDYKLIITNNSTGNEFTSTSPIIDSIVPTMFYQPIAAPYYPVTYSTSNPAWYYLYNNIPPPSVQLSVRFNSIVNAREYQVKMRFHYYDRLQTGDSVAHYVDMDLPSATSNELTGGELLTFNYYLSSLYDKIASELTANGPSNLLNRRAVKMDFIVTAAAQEFSDFLKISAPSTSVAQDKPIYTNIVGGYGIFSSRSRLHISKHLHSDFHDYIASHKPMCDLRFVNSSSVLSTSCN